MITIFNRRDVYKGYDLKTYSNIRTVLSDNHIPYETNVKNRMGQWAGPGTLRGRTGSFGQSSDMMYEYKIYVHKSDYEQAMYLIQNKR